MTIYGSPPELTFIRNVHTLRASGTIGSEYTPPSKQGAQEEIAAAKYLRENMGDRALVLFYSPFASRSRTTSINIMNELDNRVPSPPDAWPLYVSPGTRSVIDASTQSGPVADAEVQAVENLKHYLEALRKQMGAIEPIVVMSGLAILKYFTGNERNSRALVNRIVPTGAVIHEGVDRFKGFIPHGHKADALAKYLEEQRMMKNASRR